MRATRLLACLLLATAASASAQTGRWNPAAPENRHHVPTFNYATVESVLAAIGARWERRGTPDRPALSVTFANNRRAALVFGSCERQGAFCKALSIQAVWNRPETVPAERMAANIQAFNRRFAFARAFETADGRAALQRYLTADYGFIRGNLAVNLLVFASQADRFATEVLR
ncbi:MAG: YbjN domain-containing protein [Sphingosinicella sp.]